MKNINVNNLKDVVHDLKIPITSIMGFVELLQNGTHDTKTQHEFYDIIMSESKRLISLIDDILHTPENSSGPEFNKCNINVQINKYLKELSPLATKKNIEISLNINADDVYVPVPENKISRILTNIIENAIKYNKEKGKISVDINQTGQKVYVKITDTGIGIPDSDLQKIFNKNYRSDISKQLNISGSGLGLAIAKDFAEEYGGSIHVKSTLGEGTEFTISFPTYDSNGSKNF